MPLSLEGIAAKKRPIERETASAVRRRNSKSRSSTRRARSTSFLYSRSNFRATTFGYGGVRKIVRSKPAIDRDRLSNAVVIAASSQMSSAHARLPRPGRPSPLTFAAPHGTKCDWTSYPLGCKSPISQVGLEVRRCTARRHVGSGHVSPAMRRHRQTLRATRRSIRRSAGWPSSGRVCARSAHRAAPPVWGR
jgi:hypothetical protein